jgi:hypothetical protein
MANALADDGQAPGPSCWHGAKVILRPTCRPASCPLTQRPADYRSMLILVPLAVEVAPVAFARARRRLGWLTYALSPSYRSPPEGQRRAGRACRRPTAARGGRGRPPGVRTAAAVAAPGRPAIADPVRWDGAGVRCSRLLDQGRGLVLLTPHLGSFEVSAQAYAERFGARQPITVLYRPARKRWLRELEETARARPALATAPATLAGVRQMLRALQARRDGRPAARPGAARRHGRVGAVLRPAGLHDDAGRAPGAADRRGRRPAVDRAPAAVAGYVVHARRCRRRCPRAAATRRRRGHQPAMEP